MISPTLAPPRRTSGPRKPEPVQRRTGYPSSVARHERRERRVWRWALATSVLAHLLVLLLSPIFLRVGLPPGDLDSADDAQRTRGMQMVDLAGAPDRPSMPIPVPVEGLDPDQPTAFDRVDRIVPRTPRPAEPAPVGPGAAAPAPAPGASERQGGPLQPGMRDPRLWIPPREVPRREPTQEELHAEYMASLEARLRTWNDSVAGEADRARRATDWTVRDGQGGRWGVSPEGIHLGGVTLPPATFPPGGGDPDKRARAEEQERARRDLDRQQADQERRRVRDERIRATRERSDRERQQ
jgi:hypothetical protein